jgi:hypothetical protein
VCLGPQSLLRAVQQLLLAGFSSSGIDIPNMNFLLYVSSLWCAPEMCIDIRIQLTHSNGTVQDTKWITIWPFWGLNFTVQ